MVLWEHIVREYPRVKQVKANGKVVALMRDSDRSIITPRCIKSHPGIILTVVESLADSSISTVTDSTDQSTIRDDSSSSSSSITLRQSSVPQFEALAAEVRRLEADIEKQLISTWPPEIQDMLNASPDFYGSIAQFIKEGPQDFMYLLSETFLRCFLQLKDLKTQLETVHTNKEEAWKQQRVQPLSQLSQYRSQVQAILAQKQELHENPPPRLFVVLPMVDNSRWNYENLLDNKLRLYFLCECGEHTRSANSKNPHIHFAKHEGYDIDRPEEFFEQYGSYVLVILRMLKFRLSVPGVDVPPVSDLIHQSKGDQPSADLEAMAGDIESRIDRAIGGLERIVGNDTNGFYRNIGMPTYNDTSGRMGIRSMEAFLKRKDDRKASANLFRTVTDKGYVKWVCNDHFRENYLYRQESADALRRLVAVRGERDEHDGPEGMFGEDVGRLQVQLHSPTDADGLFAVLDTTMLIHELNITLFWKATDEDLKRLRDTLLTTSVSVVELDLQRGKQYGPAIDIMRQPSVQSFTIAGTDQNFFSQFYQFSGNDTFPNLRYLDIGKWVEVNDIPFLSRLVALTPNLTQLKLWTPLEQLPATYSALVEHQTYPIVFTNLSLRILPPPPRGESVVPVRDLSQFFRVHGRQIEAVHTKAFRPENSRLDEMAVEAFAAATRTGSALKELMLEAVGHPLSDKCIQHFADIVSRSEIRRLQIDLEDQGERAIILEGIRWKHIRQLWISIGCEGQRTRLARALERGSRSQERVELEHLMLDCHAVMSQEDANVLRSFVSRMPLKHLELYWAMSLEQVLSLYSPNFLLLRTFSLSAEHFKKSEVQRILDSIQHVADLQALCLRGADINRSQRTQMKSKRISLLNIC